MLCKCWISSLSFQVCDICCSVSVQTIARPGLEPVTVQQPPHVFTLFTGALNVSFFYYTTTMVFKCFLYTVRSSVVCGALGRGGGPGGRAGALVARLNLKVFKRCYICYYLRFNSSGSSNSIHLFFMFHIRD